MPWEELDPSIRSTVRAFLNAGFDTSNSCSGHYTDRGWGFADSTWESGYIVFSGPEHRVNELKKIIKKIPNARITPAWRDQYTLHVYFVPATPEQVEKYGWPKWRHMDMSKKTNAIFKKIERGLEKMSRQ